MMMATGSEHTQVYSRSSENSPAYSRKQSLDPEAETYLKQKYYVHNSSIPRKSASVDRMAPGPAVFAHQDEDGDDGQPSLFQQYNKKFRR